MKGKKKRGEKSYMTLKKGVTREERGRGKRVVGAPIRVKGVGSEPFPAKPSIVSPPSLHWLVIQPFDSPSPAHHSICSCQYLVSSLTSISTSLLSPQNRLLSSPLLLFLTLSCSICCSVCFCSVCTLMPSVCLLFFCFLLFIFFVFFPCAVYAVRRDTHYVIKM